MIAFKTYTQSQTLTYEPVGEMTGCLMDCTNGDVTITLPEPTAAMEGCQIVFIKTDDTLNEAFVTLESGDTFNGTSYSTYYSPYARLDAFIVSVVNGNWVYIFNAWIGYP